MAPAAHLETRVQSVWRRRPALENPSMLLYIDVYKRI
jgi:hypothetical protein